MSRSPAARRVGEVCGLAGKSWVVLVPGVAAGVYGLVVFLRDADQSGWFWLFLGALSFAAVFAWVAYQALKQRDEVMAKPRGPTITFHDSSLSRIGSLYREGPASEPPPEPPEKKSEEE